MRSFSLGFFNSLRKVLHPFACRTRQSLFITDGTSPACVSLTRISVNAKGISAKSTVPHSVEDCCVGGDREINGHRADMVFWKRPPSTQGEAREFVRSPEPGA